MASDVLREFLVAIKYKSDPSSERKFTEGLENATKRAVALAVAVEGAALAVAAAVTRMALKFDDLYYSSQRIGASAGNIKAFAYGVSQAGGTAAGAMASLENFARFMKMNPIGSENLLKNLGVQTREANGLLKSRDQLAEGFAKALQGKQYAVQSKFAEMVGIDEHTLHALMRGIDSFGDEYRAAQKRMGLDPDKAAKDGNALAQTYRKVGATIEAIGDKITSKLFDDQNNTFQRFITFLEQHGDKIAEVVSKLFSLLMRLTEALLALATSDKARAFLDGILSTFGKLNEKTGEWEADLDKLKIALEVFAAFVVGTWAIKLIGAFGKVGAGWAGMLGVLGLGAIANQNGILAPGRSGEPGVGRGVLEFLDPGLADRVYGRGKQPDDKEKPGLFRRGWEGLKSAVGITPASASTDQPQGGGGMGKRAERAATADKANPNYTGSNANVLRQAAADLGTSPEDLATVISYESKFDPKRWGGKGGNYLGLIQFGGPERKQFGVNENQTFAEQMPSVVKFLKTRGFKPGMGLPDLYSTINAGSPGRYNLSDDGGKTTVAGHVERMRKSEAARVNRFLASPDEPPNVAPKTVQPDEASNVTPKTVQPDDRATTPDAKSSAAEPLERAARALGKADFSNRALSTAPVSNTSSSVNSTNVAPTFNTTINGISDPKEAAMRVDGSHKRIARHFFDQYTVVS